jgi:Tol biopolymer transport system component
VTDAPLDGLLNGDSYSPSISADGRWVAYVSSASNLVPDDLNETSDIFLYDRSAKETILVSRGLEGMPADGASGNPVISLNGSWIVFASEADNLVAVEKRWEWAVYLYNRLDGTISLASVSSDGLPANGWSNWPSISADGRSLVFASTATNLAPGTNRDQAEVYIHDRQTGLTELVSLGADGSVANGLSDKPIISFDGRLVAFWSWANNLVPGEAEYCRDAENPGPCADIYIFDRENKSMERIPVGQSGGLGGGGDELSLSGDGRTLTYYSVVIDRQSLIEESICEPLEFGWCGYAPSVSSNGRWIAYGTVDSRQVWVYDRQTGETTQISIDSEGQPANADSGLVFFYEGFFGSLELSFDGRLIVYASQATNLISEDLGLCEDLLTLSGPRPCYGIFLFDRQTGLTELVSHPNPPSTD